MHQHTFVVLAYKVSPFLEECLSSLRDQSFVSSIIIATSTPSRFIDEMGRTFGYPVHINTKSGGIGSDWNFGLAQASTPFVTLAHQDDIYDRTYSEKMLKAANERRDSHEHNKSIGKKGLDPCLLRPFSNDCISVPKENSLLFRKPDRVSICHVS